MKIALLDLNVLVALSWPSHIHHEMAHRWFKKQRQYGWATCPITQSGLVRLSSNAKIITDAVSPMDAYKLLEKLISLPDHHFWSDNISLSEATVFQNNTLLGHRQITDAYLLSLAIHNNGRLITFDKGIKSLLPKSTDEHLYLLSTKNKFI